jgi:hypothetical protein
MMPATPAHQIDYKKFIKFHPACSGSEGRTVYIDPNLLVRFAELIDPATHAGLHAVQGLIGLKNSAAGVTCDTNQNSAMQHRATLGNIVATYSVLQNGGRGAGVYVTNLQQGHGKDGDRPGLYSVVQATHGQYRWRVKEDSSPALPTSVGVLGALPPVDDQLNGANESANFFAGTLLKKEGRAANVFSLFYTPSYTIDGMGVWLTADQKSGQSAGDCARKFAQLLANTAKKPPNAGDPERFKWYIVGQGLKVFQQAFAEYRAICREPLGKRHEIYFVDPQGPVGLLQQELRDQMVDFNRDNLILTDTMGLASRLHQLVDPSEAFINFYRSWERFRNVNRAVEEGNKIYNQRTAANVYFSDLIKQLGAALINPNKKW